MAASKHALPALVLSIFISPAMLDAAAPAGYYRQPALHGDTLVIVSEGDLWKVRASGGVATRLTSHAGDESQPAISPDGQTLAFVAQYEGPGELYTMPLAGGLPTRRTFHAARITFVGWTPDRKLLYSTDVHSTLPSVQLVVLDAREDGGAARPAMVPLAQSADGAYDDAGRTLYFTRLPFQGSHTRRYKGGTAQNIWKFADGDAEAVPLTADYPGTSKEPMWWQGRIYFASDRDGTMNLWSMTPDGSDLRQHTRHAGWDVASPSLHGGRIAYQLGADVQIYDIAANQDRNVPITLDSDFDQTREHWIKAPMDYMTSAHPSPDANRVAITARGRIFVAPHRQGRFVEAARKEGVRYRDARFLPDGKTLLAMSDESGEVEFWKLPANGVGDAEQLTRDGDVLRWEGVPSPNGGYVAHHDKNQRLFIYDVEKKDNRKIDESTIGDFGDLRWSADSKWLAYVAPAANSFRQIKLYSIDDATITAVTTDRYDSYSPAWSLDGKWLYLLSDRNLESIVGSPWGSYQPEPYLDKMTRIYQIALSEGLRSPFAPADELHPDEPKEEPKPATSQPATQSGTQPATQTGATQTAPATAATAPASSPSSGPATQPTKIELADITGRLIEIPLPQGNYANLAVNDKALFYMSRATGESKWNLMGVNIARESVEAKTILSDMKSFELTPDCKKMLVHKDNSLYLLDPAAAPADLDKKDVNLSGWSLSTTPREEWRQMFVEAWRLERDYFYDRGMHGVNWRAMLDKYLPLVDRVSTRGELSDLMAQMVSELSALHIFVGGGDMRRGDDHIMPASLGAVLARDPAAGGYRVEHIFESDPDEPSRAAPLARPEVNVKAGDVIESVNGVPVLQSADISQLLRQKAGQQVLLRVRPASGGDSRDVIVAPISLGEASDLRYHEWEYRRRRMVEELGKGDIGYVHLRAMGGGNFTEWARGFYPVFTRKGLIVDVRHNRGGNIDSWILGRLLRKAWFYWSQRVGLAPNWNMQYAFRGHVAVLCDQFTASDGEAFTEGVKRLGIGKVIGTRTWGGEIWLSASNFLVDKGIATAAEYGVYGPEGVWLIEGQGVEPDMVVDNLPHATFKGEDAQLKAAIEYLQREIREKPIQEPTPPKYPDKSR